MDAGGDNMADGYATGTGFIEVVNGVGTGADAAAGTPKAVTVTVPANREINFTLNSRDAGSTVPVIFADADNDNQVDLVAPSVGNNDPKLPSEAFGIGGAKTWVPVEASTQNFDRDWSVTTVNKAAGYFIAQANADSTADDATSTAFTGDVRTFYFRPNDNVLVSTGEAANAASSCLPTTYQNWLNNLSAGDQIDVNSVYVQGESPASTLCLEDLTPAVPGAAPTFTQTTGTSTRVTSAAVAGADEYVFLRSTTTGGPYTEVGRSSTVNFDDTGLSPNTTYYYVTRSVVDGDESANSAEDDVTTLAADATVRPLMVDARVTTDSGIQGRADTGDIWAIVFNKNMNASTTDGLFVLRDAQGREVQVDCDGGNATCVLNAAPAVVGGTTYAANRVLTVTLTAALSGGTPAVNVEYPLTITTTDSDVADAQGNIVNVADSADRVIDVE